MHLCNAEISKNKGANVMEEPKRKTITYSKRILEPIRRLNDVDRLQLYDALNDYFLDDKPFDYDTYSYTVQTLLPWLALEIRKLETKYSNSKSTKNSVSLFNCAQIVSELQANDKRTISELKADNINIPYNNYNSNNIYNFLYKQTTARAHTREEINKKDNDGDSMSVAIKNISALDSATGARIETLIKQLQSGNEKIKISGEPTERAKILQAINELLLSPNTLEQLQSIFKDIDSTPNVRNPFKYTISYIYNVALERGKPDYSSSKPRELDYMRHNYAPEQLNDLFDNLDDVEIE